MQLGYSKRLDGKYVVLTKMRHNSHWRWTIGLVWRVGSRWANNASGNIFKTRRSAAEAMQ